MTRRSMRTDPRGPAAVGLYNPLPRMLAHYAVWLRDTLERAGVDARPVVAVDGEIGLSGASRVATLARHLGRVARARRAHPTTISLWPLLGWYDLPLWAGRDGSRLVVVHDPTPLRPQPGLGPRSAALARRLGRFGPTLIVHSPAALDEVRRHLPSANVVTARHPIRAAAPPPRPAGPTRVLVLGQYKPSRDVDVLARIAPALRTAGYLPEIRGVGWPPVDGWQVVPGFVPEADVDGLLRESAALLLPYSAFYQSGVAIRAVENGCPVVGSRTGFLDDLCGLLHPGFVDAAADPQSWVTAVRAAAGPAWDAAAVHARYLARVERDWTGVADLLREPRGRTSPH